MNYRRILTIFVSILLVLVGIVTAVSADGNIRYVAPSGSDTSDCINSAFPCATVQYAVDRADVGDEVRVAEGTYTGVNGRGGLSQIAYISKTITIRGGYATTDWSVSDPKANPATLDAQGNGRGVYAAGNITLTIEGLRVTGGNAAGLGGGPSGHDAGGGVYIANTRLTIDNSEILSSTISRSLIQRVYGYGGGAYLSSDIVTLTNSTIENNTIAITSTQSGTPGHYAYGYGGGLYLDGSAVLVDNVVANNAIFALVVGTSEDKRSISRGGGIYLCDGNVTLTSNSITSNTLSAQLSNPDRNDAKSYGYGGGLYASSNGLTLTGNLVAQNVISNSVVAARFGAYAIARGGGLYLKDDATLTNNIVTQNTVSGSATGAPYAYAYVNGGGLYLGKDTLIDNTVTQNTVYGYALGATLTREQPYGGGIYLTQDGVLTNNTVEYNTAKYGGGIYLVNSPRLAANTITNNTASDGGGLYASGGNPAFTNNLITDNHADNRGGGLYLSVSSTFTNDVIADNTATIGDGLYVSGDSIFLHTTIARNGDTGIHVAGGTSYLTNTIIAGHTTGITVASGTANLDYTLWYDNGANWGGGGAVWHTNDFSGDPAFAADGYHLTDSSMAMNRGKNTGVGVDVDGDGRPIGDGYDIGADEHTPICFARVSDGVNDGPILHSVQRAIDAASPVSDVVKVAGTCSAVETWGVYTQIAYITKSLTLQGGYTTTHWTTPDPQVFPTTLDAESQGRVIYVSGPITVTIDGFHVTNGNSGGIYAYQATITISNDVIYDNQANSGGGVGLSSASSVLIHNQIYSNTATGGGYVRGGGVFIYRGDSVLTGNVIRNNTASGVSQGGGVYGGLATITLDDNTISDNQALGLGKGGGVYWYRGSGTIRDNRIVGNTAISSGQGDGGGLFFYNTSLPSSSAITVDANIIANNTVIGGGGWFGGYGGGIGCQRDTFIVTNNVVADNSASTDGSGVFLRGCTVDMLYNTVARNTGGSGRGVDARLYYNGSTVHLTNTIVASQTVGVYVDSNSAATLDTTLWGGNGTDWTGSTIVTDDDLWGNPAFANADIGDYHITEGSGAIDQGIDVGITHDVDGHPRPLGSGYDIGADEFGIVLTITKSAPTVVVGAPLTYTLVVSNTGQKVALDVVVTDAVPTGASYLSGGVESNGVITWSGLTINAGSVATATFTVTTCQASLTNERYRVLTSTEGVTTAWGASLVTDLVPPTIDVGFDLLPTTVFSGGVVDFDDTSITNGGVIVDWRWDFGDGDTGSGRAVTHTYTAASAYTVTLVVTDTCGYASAASHTVYVTSTPFVPIYGVNLTPSSMAASGDPGDDVTYTLWLTNTGNVADTFDLTLDGNVWTTVVDPAMVNLQPSEMHDVTVTVSIAGTAQHGDTDVFTVTTTSQISPAMMDSSVLTTSVNVAPCTELTGVAIAGVSEGYPGIYTFTTDYDPVIATPPIVYLWDNGDTVATTVRALDVGTRTLVVTATNCDGTQVVDTHTITISAPPVCIGITDVGIVGEDVGQVGTDYAFTTQITPSNATPLVSYTWSPAPTQGQDTNAATYGWGVTGTYTVTVTATNCDGMVSDIHSIRIEPARIYLPLVMRNYAGQMTRHELEDAPDTCPGHGIEVGNHLYQDDFDAANDHDWYSFEAIAGQTYTIQTSELELRADTSIVLYAGDCTTILAESDDIAWPENVASRIVWTAQSNGTYHVDVRSYDWQVHGNDTGYTFGVGVGAAADTNPALESMPGVPVKPSPPARP